MTRIKFNFAAGLGLFVLGLGIGYSALPVWRALPWLRVELIPGALPDIAHTLVALGFLIAAYVVVRGMVLPRDWGAE